MWMGCQHVAGPLSIVRWLLLDVIDHENGHRALVCLELQSERKRSVTTVFRNAWAAVILDEWEQPEPSMR